VSDFPTGTSSRTTISTIPFLANTIMVVSSAESPPLTISTRLPS
tara:strand:- start:203 stop:334 length:132 start_codon:yes stop_codon:yes gene_type:complete